MKTVLILLLTSALLCAQPESAKAINRDPSVMAEELLFELVSYLAKQNSETEKLSTFGFVGKLIQANAASRPTNQSPSRAQISLEPPGTVDLTYAPVDAVLTPVYGYYSGVPTRYTASSFSPSLASARNGHLTTVQPVTLAGPQMIFLDGFGNSLIDFDLTTQTTASQVVVGSTVGPFAIRPSATGSSNEVWVGNYGLQVSICDLGSQTVVATIPTPSLPSSAPPAGIVFTPDGAKAFESIIFYSPDSAGNTGALLVFDAVGRTLISTQLLKNTPGPLVMAPDGSTLYIVESTSSGESIAYYDILSGAADLLVPTYTPGFSSGYSGGALFIHPDGTRLFWNINYLFFVFDLTTRKVTHQFTSGLPSTAGPAMTMSRDGSRVYFYDQAGDLVVVDTLDGTILSSSTSGVPTSVFPGPPVAR